MLIVADAKQLEFRVAAYLSQDKVAIEEILYNVDQHSDNQKRFNLPSRLIAKTFVFRLLYGGSAYAYASDPTFKDVGYNKDQWQQVIDEFYNKYKGIKAWHDTIVKEATSSGRLVSPTGRVYTFQMEGDKWPITKIKNYVVQGLAADLMSIARVSCWNRLKQEKDIKFINTVHDSIVLDVDRTIEGCYNIIYTLEKVFEDIPLNFKKLFKTEFNVPLKGEISYGLNLKELNEYQC